MFEDEAADIQALKRYTVRKRVLEDAANCVLKDRNASYGEPHQDFKRTAELWTAMWGHKLKDGEKFEAHDVALGVIQVKVSRIQSGIGTLDNWTDTAGYAACGAECQSIEGGHDWHKKKKTP